MGQIKINGSFFGEENQRENNYSLEYFKRTLTEHKEKTPLDHPDGSVTKEKLSAEVRDRMNKHESDIQEISNSKADKTIVYTKSETDTILSTKADKTIVYTKSETDTILSTKADKATTYTIAQTDTKLSTKADKAYTYTKAEVQSKENELIEVLDEVLNQQENHSDTTWFPPINPVFPSPSEPSIPDIDFET